MEPAEFSVTLVCEHPTEVLAFYQRWFGMEIVLDLGWFGTVRRPGATWEVCVWQRGHESIPPGVGSTPNGIALAFVVDDAAAVHAAMSEVEVSLASGLCDEPWGQRHFYLNDPSGALIDVVEFTQPNGAWLAAQGESQSEEVS